MQARTSAADGLLDPLHKRRLAPQVVESKREGVLHKPRRLQAVYGLERLPRVGQEPLLHLLACRQAGAWAGWGCDLQILLNQS